MHSLGTLKCVPVLDRRGSSNPLDPNRLRCCYRYDFQLCEREAHPRANCVPFSTRELHTTSGEHSPVHTYYTFQLTSAATGALPIGPAKVSGTTASNGRGREAVPYLCTWITPCRKPSNFVRQTLGHCTPTSNLTLPHHVLCCHRHKTFFILTPPPMCRASLQYARGCPSLNYRVISYTICEESASVPAPTMQGCIACRSSDSPGDLQVGIWGKACQHSG